MGVATPPPSLPGDGPALRVLRRSVTIPAFTAALLAWVALLPALLPVALASDLLLRRRLAATRTVAGVLAFLGFEVLGVLAVGALAVTGRATRDRMYALEAGWAGALLRILLRLFSMRLQVEGLDAVRPGPVVMIGNHVSVVDALLPAALATGRAGLRLRYVAKGELVWDPAVDLAGHLLPNVFVRRGSADTPGDQARVRALLDGIGPDEGVVLFPEGTRFTEARRAARLAKRAADGPFEHLERDRRLRCLLPPRTGGLLALFEGRPGTDVVVMAHAGLEGIVGIPDLLGGALIGRTLRVAFWRLPGASIPAGREAQVEWIYAQWERLDAWLAAARGATLPRPAPRASVRSMLANLKGKLSGVYRSLTRTAGEQPLHKLALAVVLLLDLFILISIFDGLDVHTRQLASPGELVPARCREMVIDRSWTPGVRLERLAAAARERRSLYRDPDERERPPVPACARVLVPIREIAADPELGELLEKWARLSAELEDAEAELAREKGAYDTRLLERLARPGAERPDVEAIRANVQRRTAAIEAARERRAGLEARLGAAPQVAALWELLDGLGPADSASLAAELRRLERWYQVKRLGMQLLFLLPLLAAFTAWHAASARRGRGLQALVAAHLAVVTAIPLLFRLGEAVYEIVPKRLLKRLIDLLVSLKLVALWHYLVIAVAVAAGLFAVFAIQRWLFSRERLLERRIGKGLCQRCGKRLPRGAKACPFCGYPQHRTCAACGQPTPAHAPFCAACGAQEGGR